MINAGETIKNLRKEYGLSQETLARAIYVDKVTISNYENSKRMPDLNRLEEILNVFGYTLDLKLIEKKEGCKPKDFFLDKTASEIENMSKEDLVDYIFLTQSNNTIANICSTTVDIIELLPLSSVKELISKRIDKADRLTIFFKIKELNFGIEEKISSFIDNVKYHLENESELNSDILEKVTYIEVETYLSTEGCDYGDYYYYFDNIKLFDKNKNLLTDDFNDINGYNGLPLDVELDMDLGEYLMINSPALIKLNY